MDAKQKLKELKDELAIHHDDRLFASDPDDRAKAIGRERRAQEALDKFLEEHPELKEA